MKITRPKSIITNATPIFQWKLTNGDTVTTPYALKVKNNVTDEVVFEITTSELSYTHSSPLPLGTYAIEVKNGELIDVSIFIISPKLAQYSIVGRDGDEAYTDYKAYQKTVRQYVKQLGDTAKNLLASNANIGELIKDDARLLKFHAETIAQTPGLADDLALIESLANQVLVAVNTLRLRDNGF